jgi:hypothetical protein
MKKTFINLKIILKSFELFKKASIPLKNSQNLLKSLRFLIKASISLKISSKGLVVIIEADNQASKTLEKASISL